MKRAAQPEELSPAYVFLASPVCAGYITGIVLPVTGQRRRDLSRAPLSAATRSTPIAFIALAMRLPRLRVVAPGVAALLDALVHVADRPVVAGGDRAELVPRAGAR